MSSALCFGVYQTYAGVESSVADNQKVLLYKHTSLGESNVNVQVERRQISSAF
jgi:hypothetical protein